MVSCTKIGLVGTGFIATNFATMVANSTRDRYDIASILTRRDIKTLTNFPFQEKITNSLKQLIDRSDLIIECSGDVFQATTVTEEAMNAGLPVLTMNSEFHTTTGAYFADKGYLSECQGDQPGCIAALKEEAELMGFKSLVLGNFKGYLNTNPSREDMQHWADLQEFTLKQTTSFTDGTKVQIEQAFVANAFGGTILQEGLLGTRHDDYKTAAKHLAELAQDKDQLIADYVISDQPLPTGVFIAGTHNDAQQKSLSTYKLGDGPFYVLNTAYHLCAFEILKTVNRYLLGLPPLLNNTSTPTISVAAIAKKQLEIGTMIPHAIGSFELRGETVFADKHPEHVPIGILENAHIKRTVEPGQIITYDDIDLPETRALELVRSIFG